MKKLIVLFALLLPFAGLQAQKLKGLMDKAKGAVENASGGEGLNLSSDQIGAGLKEALDKGVGEAVSFLSAENGYYESVYKVLLPEEVQMVTSKLKAVPGFSDAEEKMILLLNRAAEDAAEKAKPIFVSAIKQMTFKDATNILMGEQDAATRYLQRTTFDALYGEFKPVINTSLAKVNASSYWTSLVTAYNKLPLVKKTNPDLEDYVTRQALTGMFGLVEQKEADIRSNVSSRNTDLLRNVFAKQDKG